MRKIIFLLIGLMDFNVVASGDPLVAVMGVGSIFLWLFAIFLQFFIKSSKKGKILSALNLCLGLVIFLFLVSLPYGYKTYLIGALIMIMPIFFGIVNLLILRVFR